MSLDFDVIVVGVGAMGSSTCFELARRGVRVLGLERFGIAHELGSSHGLSRMIRMAYYEHPDYVPLLRRAYERWHELERITHEKILHITGGLYMSPVGGGLVDGSLKSAEKHNLPHEMLGAAAIRSRFPQFQLPDDWHAFYEPMAGYLVPERAISAYVHAARGAGAEVHSDDPVTGWRNDGSHLSVTTDRETYTAKHLCFCGGAWSAKLLRDLNVELTVTRQILGWLKPHDPGQFARGRFPCWAIDRPDGSIYYGFSIGEDDPGLKMAHHRPSTRTDPDAIDRSISAEDEREIRAIASSFLSGVRPEGGVFKTCLYTNSPDSHFILGTHPHHDNVSIACGFSGHGFKFASVVGEALADLATDGRSALPIEFLSPARFPISNA